MCVIIYKPAYVSLPTDEIIKNCFANNPDGAGIAIHKPGTSEVAIRKGFMDVDSFLAYTSITVGIEDTAIYHFRIGTSGGNTAGNCHPFPITDRVHSLKALSVKSRYAFAHNGIIGEGHANLSDTQLYIKDVLAKLDLLQTLSPELQDRIAHDTQGSRTILLDGQTGTVMQTGDWITDSTTGLSFSNSSYLAPPPMASMALFSAVSYWPQEEEYGDEDEAETLGALTYDDALPCPECSRYGYCISPEWELFECQYCHSVFDSSGTTHFTSLDTDLDTREEEVY